MSDKSVSQGIISGKRGTGSGGGGLTEISNFSFSDINWLTDSTEELWDKPGAELCFISDFVTSKFKTLKFVKSIFGGTSGFIVGRFAVYGSDSVAGSGQVKLLEDDLFDYGTAYYTSTFAPIDISAYHCITICMDPGLGGINQPIKQILRNIPLSPSLAHYAFSGMGLHEHNTAFPEPAPTMITSDEKYFLARWMAIGVE